MKKSQEVVDAFDSVRKRRNLKVNIEKSKAVAFERGQVSSELHCRIRNLR